MGVCTYIIIIIIYVCTLYVRHAGVVPSLCNCENVSSHGICASYSKSDFQRDIYYNIITRNKAIYVCIIYIYKYVHDTVVAGVFY